MSDNRFTGMFGDADTSFNDKYQAALDNLKGLTDEQVQSVSPGTSNKAELDKLIAVVQNAKDQNLSQADLITNIKELGSIAIKLAKKVPQFASLL